MFAEKASVGFIKRVFRAAPVAEWLSVFFNERAGRIVVSDRPFVAEKIIVAAERRFRRAVVIAHSAGLGKSAGVVLRKDDFFYVQNVVFRKRARGKIAEGAKTNVLVNGVVGKGTRRKRRERRQIKNGACPLVRAKLVLRIDRRVAPRRFGLGVGVLRKAECKAEMLSLGGEIRRVVIIDDLAVTVNVGVQRRNRRGDAVDVVFGNRRRSALARITPNRHRVGKVEGRAFDLRRLCVLRRQKKGEGQRLFTGKGVSRRDGENSRLFAVRKNRKGGVCRKHKACGAKGFFSSCRSFPKRKTAVSDLSAHNFFAARFSRFVGFFLLLYYHILFCL